MRKKEVYDWLKSILIDFSEKEVDSICKNSIDDKIALDYLKKQHKTNKETFETNLLHLLTFKTPTYL